MFDPATGRPLPSKPCGGMSGWARDWGPLLLGLGMLALAGWVLLSFARTPAISTPSAPVFTRDSPSTPLMTTSAPAMDSPPTPGIQSVILVTVTPTFVPTKTAVEKQATATIQAARATATALAIPPTCGLPLPSGTACMWPTATPTPLPPPSPEPTCWTPVAGEICITGATPVGRGKG